MFDMQDLMFDMQDLMCDSLYATANTMWRKLLYSGFRPCFAQHPAPKVLGPDIKTHLKSRFCAILKKGALMFLS